MSSILPLSDDEREMLVFDRGLSTDADGNEILVGLTVDESEEYLSILHAPHGALAAFADYERFDELSRKFQEGRRAVIGAEDEAER